MGWFGIIGLKESPEKSHFGPLLMVFKVVDQGLRTTIRLRDPGHKVVLTFRIFFLFEWKSWWYLGLRSEVCSGYRKLVETQTIKNGQWRCKHSFLRNALRL